MKPIDANEYFELIMKGFAHVEKKYETEEMTVITEDIFKIVWMTSLRLNSYIAFADEIDSASFQHYLMDCLGMTRQGRSKLGSPSVCNAVLITENASKDIIAFARKRPTIHASMTEYPIVVDLATGETHYYMGPIFYGLIYAKFEREYIEGHFAMPLRFLEGKRAIK